MPSSKLNDISVQMFRFYLVVDTHVTTLEQRNKWG